ncbi:hypothetical protein HK405_007720 [Cladochytrium tenue]|nr:hypothetical protein HK405_007720 [Cladochytrium tenue]
MGGGVGRSWATHSAGAQPEGPTPRQPAAGRPRSGSVSLADSATAAATIPEAFRQRGANGSGAVARVSRGGVGGGAPVSPPAVRPAAKRSIMRLAADALPAPVGDAISEQLDRRAPAASSSSPAPRPLRQVTRHPSVLRFAMPTENSGRPDPAAAAAATALAVTGPAVSQPAAPVFLLETDEGTTRAIPVGESMGLIRDESGDGGSDSPKFAQRAYHFPAKPRQSAGFEFPAKRAGSSPEPEASGDSLSAKSEDAPADGGDGAGAVAEIMSSPSFSSGGSPSNNASPRPSATGISRRLSSIGLAMGFATGGRSSRPAEDSGSMSSRGRRRSVSSELKRVHPLVKWANDTWQWFLEQRATRFTMTVMADHRFEICAWLSVMALAHTAVTTFLVLSLSLTMPGIWVYNFVQLFVICLVVLSNVAGRKISQVVRLSIATSDLLRGAVTVKELRDYWTNGKFSPAHTVSRASSFVELTAEAIIVACSILYSWHAVPSHVLAGQCVPPDYTNSSLPENVDFQQFMQGEIDFATIDNFGLPLSDGLIGGWAGWPLSNPLEKFSISNEGPVYLIEVLCDDGIVRDDLTTDSGTALTSTVLSNDKLSVMLQTTVLMPAGTAVCDSTGQVIQSPFEQHCTIELTIGHGHCEYSFVSDEWLMVTGGRLTRVVDKDNEFDATTANSLGLYASQGRIAFFDLGDPFNVSDIVVDSVTRVLGNGTYYPSDGGIVANALRWATRIDGFYHSDSMFSGVAAAVGVAANFALMQFVSDQVQPCDYYGQVGAGRLTIPELAVIAAAVGSGIAIAVKVFEILWWALTAAPGRTPGYQRAGRTLRHPVRFAVDSALMLGGFVADRERDQDLCQAMLGTVSSRFGDGRLQFGEDVDYVQRATGHLRIGEYGKVCAIQPDRKYGTLPPPPNVEFDNLTEY